MENVWTGVGRVNGNPGTSVTGVIEMNWRRRYPVQNWPVLSQNKSPALSGASEMRIGKDLSSQLLAHESCQANQPSS
jgi:hypothetical protein